MATLLKTRTTKVSSPWVQEDRERSQFLVARKAFIDPAILDHERREIFGKCWLYVGHESEIAQPNDFVTRNVGGRELIFSRDRKGEVRVFYNTCPHRGATLVRDKSGNAISFQCFYHGWAFNNNGRFATRYQPGDYPDDFNAGGCKDLHKVKRLEHYRGLYFVNFGNEGAGLHDYLADAKTYLDIIMDHSPAGMEICGGSHEYAIGANWKLLAENSVDGYHGLPTHQTYFEYLFEGLGQDPAVVAKMLTNADIASNGRTMNARAVDLGNGHAVITAGPSGPQSWGRPVAHWIPAWGEEGRANIEARQRQLVERFGPERAEIIGSWNRNMIIFPNLVINDIMAITIRTFYPQAPDKMHVNAWSLAPKDETRAFRKQRLDNFLEFLGPGGLATPDDQEALESCQRGYRNAEETVWNDISKGMMKAAPTSSDEEQMRCFWRQWDKRMQAVA